MLCCRLLHFASTIPAENAKPTDQRDPDAREILADPPPRLERVV
jgi:hypothetical protein